MFLRAWVQAAIDGYGRASRRVFSEHFTTRLPVPVNWQIQRDRLATELHRINALTLEHRPELLGDVHLPELDPYAELFPESEIPNLSQKMKALFGKIKAPRAPTHPKQKKPSGRRPGRFTKDIVPFITRLLKEPIKWQTVTNRVNGKFGTKYTMKNLQSQYYRTMGKA
jgi:hypothetical protein